MVELQPVDAVEVTLVVDDHDQLVAEHGFSALVTVFSGGRRSSILYDGGLTPDGLANTLDIMQVDPAELRAIVVSHGHTDHHGGLEGLADRTGRRRLPLLIHPGLDNQVLISGEVPRVTEFEVGFPHAGAVNVLRNAKRLTGRDQIAGFVGGFHLTGAIFEPIIEPTVAAFAELGVGRFVPGHCTGGKATHRLAAAFPGAFIQPSVGTVLRF